MNMKKTKVMKKMEVAFGITFNNMRSKNNATNLLKRQFNKW